MQKRKNLKLLSKSKTRKKKTPMRPFYIWIDQEVTHSLDMELYDVQRRNNIFGPMKKKQAEEFLAYIRDWIQSYVLSDSPTLEFEVEEDDGFYREKGHFLDESIFRSPHKRASYTYLPHPVHPKYSTVVGLSYKSNDIEGYQVNAMLQIGKKAVSAHRIFFSIFSRTPPSLTQEGPFFELVFDSDLPMEERTILPQPAKDLDQWPKYLLYRHKDSWNWRSQGPY